MAKSKETFSKKEKEKKRLKKRQDKEAKMEERRANGGGDGSLESMLAYVDEDGNLSSTPPDPKTVRREISLEEIQLGAADSRMPSEPERLQGRIDTFFEAKGFGFIKDTTGKSIFVHVSALDDTMDVGAIVSFEVEKGPKGLSAVNVQRVEK